MNKIFNKQTALKALVYTLELLAIGLLAYLVVMPFYPEIKYRVEQSAIGGLPESKDIEKVKQVVADIKAEIEVENTGGEGGDSANDTENTEGQTENTFSGLPKASYAVSPNRLIITKIGVNAPIVESKSADYGLSKGAWHVPESSTPDKGGNTVITGHRFKYLPPNNLTFYLFDKLEAGDIVSVIWHEQDYFYRIREVKIVPAAETSILNPSEQPILTMFTCHPIYSTENRLVVIADLIEE